MIKLIDPSKVKSLPSTLLPAMIISSALAVSLLLVRAIHFDRIGYLFLAWNLFLAWIPYFFSIALAGKPSLPRLMKAFLFLLWLLFFPNAPYILTDLIHLKQRAGVPLWFDLLLLLSFAWSGLLAGLASLANVHGLLLRAIGKMRAWISVSGLLLLCGFGIYLGRFLRWNSWDAFMNPVPVLKTSFTVLRSTNAIAFTLIFSGFLLVTYLTLFSMTKADEKQ